MSLLRPPSLLQISCADGCAATSRSRLFAFIGAPQPADTVLAWLAATSVAVRVRGCLGRMLRGVRMKNRIIVAVSLIASLAVIAAGTAALWTKPLTLGAASGAAAVSPLAQMVIGALPTPDGVIYAGEYRNCLFDPETGMSLFWQNDGTGLYVGLISPGTGWLGVGFSHQTGKAGSHMILGAVADGTVTIQDSHGVTKELHLPNKTSSILAYGGSEEAGETTLEFVIPLAGSASQPVSLVPGETVQVILAYQATWDSLATEHTKYAMTEITLDP